MKLRLPLLFIILLLIGFSNALAQQRLRLTMVVRDGVTKKPIPGASLFVSETKAGARADSVGVITLNHPPGMLTLYVSAVGYIRGRGNIGTRFQQTG